MRCARWLALLLLGSWPAVAEVVPDSPLYGSLGSWRWAGQLNLATRGEWASGYPVDSLGTPVPAGWAVSPRGRIALSLSSAQTWAHFQLVAQYEQDLPTGTHDFRTEPLGVGLPDSQAFTVPVRKANISAQWGRFAMGAGLMTSHWGLGLVANDGDHGWMQGSAAFTDPRGGDRALRAFVSGSPSIFPSLSLMVGADKVIQDDTLLTAANMPVGSGLGGDTAYQIFAAIEARHDIGTRPYNYSSSGGAYVVQRWQTTSDGRYLHANVIDLTGYAERKLDSLVSLVLAGEGAYISGTTTFAPTPDHPTQKVSQLGALARIGLDLFFFGAMLDVIYASGDQNLDDGVQNGFKVNSNLQEGLFLFRRVIAGQTARAPITVSNPELVGRAPPGLERYPTRGSVTNTLAFFPRLWGRTTNGFEFYGGPLFALAVGANPDPLNTLLAGGDPRNASNGSPGNYLGTELDLGIRYHTVLARSVLSVGVEGGVLIPGSAFRDATGQGLGDVSGARLMVDYKL